MEKPATTLASALQAHALLAAAAMAVAVVAVAVSGAKAMEQELEAAPVTLASKRATSVAVIRVAGRADVAPKGATLP